MPVVTDLDSVPLTPVYTIVISTNGEATIEGEPVELLPGQDARTSALADIRIRAARRGHPIRINAKEPDGSVWPLIVDHDGAVTVLQAPHPAPPPPPAPTPPPARHPLPPRPGPPPPPAGTPRCPGTTPNGSPASSRRSCAVTWPPPRWPPRNWKRPSTGSTGRCTRTPSACWAPARGCH
ncbi:hypothetical protein ACFQ2B_14975 [Streptomyces stramineus]